LTVQVKFCDSNPVLVDVDQGSSGDFRNLNTHGRRAEGFFVKRGKSNRSKPAQAKAGAPIEAVDKALALQQSAACAGRRSTPPNVELVVRHFEQRRKLSEQKRLYLRVGDEVSHLRYEEWGTGVVIEIMTSSVPGGTCLARIRFQDGQMRCFNNDLDNEACCYFFGVRRSWDPSEIKNGIRAKFFEMKG
jgi:hypothetical protein